jgi:hypothetical protein
MKPQLILRWFWAVVSWMAICCATKAGTWSEHFASGALSNNWTGDRDDFRIVNQMLEGVSALPLTPSPFNLVEVQNDSTDVSIGVWINVVAPNLRVCSKGAVVARHSGTNGYVFALHAATQTAEIYRLSNHEMLLTKPWKIDFQSWHYVRVELHGPGMSFFIDGHEVGSLSDSESPSGAIGLAVQDVESVLFDDFTITGPNVVGNVDDVLKPEVTSVEQSPDQVTLRFTISPPYDYFVQVSSSPSPSHDWQTIATYRAKLQSAEIVFTDTNRTGPRFYRIEKVPCYCR